MVGTSFWFWGRCAGVWGGGVGWGGVGWGGMGGVGVDAVGMGFFLGGGVLVCWGMFITPLSLSLSAYWEALDQEPS